MTAGPDPTAGCIDFHPVEEVLAAARVRLSGRGGVLLFLDYDGTLTPIVGHPTEARLSERARGLLISLSRLPGCQVAIVSGRRLSELRELVGLGALAYAGNHGLELAWPGGEGVDSAALQARADLDAVMGELDVQGWPGVWVEDKGLSLTVHYRQADPAIVPEVTATLAALLEARSDRLALRSGKMTYEVRPRSASDKGQAVLRLARLLDPEGKANLFYAGDDATDEDALEVVRGGGLGVLVGERRETFADFCLEGPEALLSLLAALAEERPWLGGQGPRPSTAPR